MILVMNFLDGKVIWREKDKTKKGIPHLQCTRKGSIMMVNPHVVGLYEKCKGTSNLVCMGYMHTAHEGSGWDNTCKTEKNATKQWSKLDGWGGAIAGELIRMNAFDFILTKRQKNSPYVSSALYKGKWKLLRREITTHRLFAAQIQQTQLLQHKFGYVHYVRFPG